MLTIEKLVQMLQEFDQEAHVCMESVIIINGKEIHIQPEIEELEQKGNTIFIKSGVSDETEQTVLPSDKQ